MIARRHGPGAALAVAAVAIAIDQLTKALVRSGISPGERVDLIGGVDLVRVGNEGVAFGLLDNAGGVALVIAAIAFSALLGYFMVTANRPGLWLAIGLLAGGAIGNLIDRAREGAVTDFIDPPAWPAFNLADVEITIGVVVLLWAYLMEPGGPTEAPGSGGESGLAAGKR